MTIGATAVATALVLAACGSDDGNSTIEADPDDSTTTTVAPSSTTTAVGDASDGLDPFATATSLVNVPIELPDGSYFGFITTLIAGPNVVSGQFDLAELLTGDAARAAAAEAGGEESDDYFIKNENEQLRPILLSPDATVRDVDYDDCCDAKDTTPAQFVADRDDTGEERTAVALRVEDGQVTEIVEIYFP